MAISVDPLTDIIYVPKADLTLIQSSPEVRELDVDWFRLALLDWEDGEDAIPRPNTHTHNTEITLAGLTYARIVEILSPYTVEFEDGQYTVNCVGANHNISDKKVANQVSLIVNNAAGLITNPAIEYASFNGGVTIDVDNISGKATSGTLFPVGTPQQPSNNIDDAFLIAEFRGFPTFFVLGDLALTSSTPDLANYAFIGSGMDRTEIDIDANATVDDCEYREATVTGTLDGNNRLVECMIEDLTYVKGIIERCVLSAAVITLDGAEEAHFLDCWSGVPGVSTPTINLGGSGQALALRNYNGGIKLTNKTGAEAVSIDLNSGQIILDSTVTNGDIVCRGIGKLTDNSTGTANVLADDLLSKDVISQATWEALNIAVYYDAANGVAGTAWPIGSKKMPVNNLTDCLTICTTNGIRGIKFTGTFVISQDLIGYRVSGRSSIMTEAAVVAGVNVSTTMFELCTVTGTAINTTSMQSYNGLISDFYGFDGLIIEGGIQGTLGVKAGGTCIGKGIAFASSTDVVDANGAAFVGLDFRGMFTLKNLTGGGYFQGGGYFGTLTVDSTCDGGFGVIIGTINVVDNATNITWVANAPINLETIPEVIWNGATGLTVQSDLSFIKKIEGGRWIVSGGQMIFYDDDNITEVARFNISYDGDQNPIERTRV